MFWEIVGSIIVGWSLGMLSTWLILAKPWIDKWLYFKRTAKQGNAVSSQQSNDNPLLNRPLNSDLDIVVSKSGKS